MFKTLAFSIAVFTMTVSAQAQSIPEGFYVRGNIQVEHISDGTLDFSAGAADIVLGYKASSASSLPVGVEVGLYKFESDLVSFDTAVTPVIFIDTQIGRFSAGVPRPAFDDYTMHSRFANSVYWDLISTGLFHSSYASYAQKWIGFDSHGVRFDGASGPLRYGISVHRFVGLDWATAAASYTIGQFVVAGGIEIVETFPDNTHFVSVQGNFGRFTGSVTYFQPFVTSSTTQVTVAYNPMANLTLEASHLAYSSGGSSVTHGSVKYGHSNGTYIGANVVSVSGSSPIYGVFAGWDFNLGG